MVRVPAPANSYQPAPASKSAKAGPWVFIDDSGDGGMRFRSGSSRHIVMAACVYRQRLEIEMSIEAVENARSFVAPNGLVYRAVKEFKYSRTKKILQDRFFNAIQSVRFDVFAIVVDKMELARVHESQAGENIKFEMIFQMLRHGAGTLQNASLIIDGEDKRPFNIRTGTSLMNALNEVAPGTIREVNFADSAATAPIQIADMLAGSLRKSVLNDPVAHIHFGGWKHRAMYPRGMILHGIQT